MAALIAAGFTFTPLSNTFADAAADQALLTSGPWRVSTKGVNDSWVFAKDGTFTTGSKINGHWAMMKDAIVLSFPSGHKQVLTLPLNPNGTACMADDGSTMIAVMENPPATAANTPVPTLTPPPVTAKSAPGKEAITALLVAKPWKFVGSWWYAMRSFSPDGTFKTVLNGGGEGTWQITDTLVTLTFSDGHQDAIKLPLNPQGSEGMDKEGNPVTVIQGDIPVADTPSASIPVPALGSTSPLAFPNATPAPNPLEVQRQNATTMALLVSAPWKFTGRSWSTVHIFAKDGTFTSPEHPNEYGTWKISGNKVLVNFADGHTDKIQLPLNPKGTDSFDQGGGIDICIMQENAPETTAPIPAPTITTTPAPAKVATAPAPATNGAPVAPHAPIPSKAVTAAILTAKPWKFVGGWWYAIRSFNADGTFKGIANGGGDGTWQITDTTVALIFPDGHQDTMLLPLDPQGSTGISSRKEPILLIQGDVPVADPKPTQAPRSTSGLDYLGKTPAPAPQSATGTAALLISAPWKQIAHSWSVVRIFAQDGTFTSVDHPKEYGRWKISGNKVVLTFVDSHVDMMLLPLNPKGTDAVDPKGGPSFFILQASAAGATPAPTAAPTAAPLGNAPTPAARATPRQGGTPPPFGVQQ